MSSAVVDPVLPISPAGRPRWVILALLFGSTVLNYLDRQALSILATMVQAIWA